MSKYTPRQTLALCYPLRKVEDSLQRRDYYQAAGSLVSGLTANK